MSTARVVAMPVQTPPEGLVEMLERLTADARSGQLTGFACAFTLLARESGYGVSVDGDTPIFTLVGELHALSHRLIARRVEMPE